LIGLYRALVGLARLVAPVVAHGQGKWARGLRARNRGGERLIAWARTGRDRGRPTVWFHASSVGETLQARAVASALTADLPDLQTVFTHFSPSAEEAAAAFGAHEWDAIPWDAPGPVAKVVSAVEPDLLVFTQREVWPVLADAVTRRGGRTALVAATLPESAGRLRGLARRTLAGAMSRLSLVAAIGDVDGERFLKLGVPAAAIRVTGDPGADSALARLEATPPEADVLAPFAEAVPSLVAGSTWPEDERVLCPALDRYLAGGRPLRVIVAPHEPTVAAVRALSATLRSGGWDVATLAETLEQGGRVASGQAVVVERTGVLAGLYRVATVSFVGGGFGRNGLHSVLEPAAAGTPVLFGPRGHSLAAGALLHAGGAREVRDTRSLSRVLDEWLGQDGSRDAAGDRARTYIVRQSGAALRSAESLGDLLKLEA
jgi:3-deoxy-D-manno-octulosonic-acid transferase